MKLLSLAFNASAYGPEEDTINWSGKKSAAGNV